MSREGIFFYYIWLFRNNKAIGLYVAHLLNNDYMMHNLFRALPIMSFCITFTR